LSEKTALSQKTATLPPLEQTAHTRLRRSPTRAVFDREKLYEIFDQAHVGHVGFSMDGRALVIPMLCWRLDNRLYLHGSNGSRMVKALTSGADCCVTATLLDGMVLAKSAFHHSSNYRSAMVFGSFQVVEDEAELEASLIQFMENIAPGRWQEVREPTANEMAATTVLAIDIEEASVKVRAGGPNDDADDLDLPVWSGVMQMQQLVTAMTPDRNSCGETPDYQAVWQERWQP
jgi:nitroimidazol reductase NimA-like FMN-containing flavoprotein (pyridoxamine 5'-phosphate oxidase superfamily)